MAGKVAFLDRGTWPLYGPEAADARANVARLFADAVRRMWPEEGGRSAQVGSQRAVGDAFYFAVLGLSPHNDTQRALKAQAATSWWSLAELRSLLQAQAIPSISKPLLIALVCWLVVIFFGFSVIAPPNATTTLALVASAFLSCLRGFPNSGTGPPFCRPDSDSQRADDECLEPALENDSVRTAVIDQSH